MDRATSDDAFVVSTAGRTRTVCIIYLEQRVMVSREVGAECEKDKKK